MRKESVKRDLTEGEIARKNAAESLDLIRRDNFHLVGVRTSP